MKREQQLKKRSRTLHTLNEAVTAMKSLAAHHFLLARKSLEPGREYRSEIENLIKRIGLPQPLVRDAPVGIVLLTSDLGLCADFNSRLARYAVELNGDFSGSRYYVVGRRGCNALAKQHLEMHQQYAAPASVDGLAGRLLKLAEDVVADYANHEVSCLTVISARFEGAGRFSVTETQVLPIKLESGNGTESHPAITSPYQTHERLLEVAVREYLYITLYELMLDSLAAEHGMRLIAAETARKWIDESNQTVLRQIGAVRRENSTQEVLDIVAASRKRFPQ